MNLGRNEIPVYLHRSQLDNRSAFTSFVLLSLGPAIFTFIIFSLIWFPLILHLDNLWSSPMIFVIITIGIFMMGIPFLIFYVSIPQRFMITNKGIYTSYSRFSNILKVRQRFIPYDDIKVIFPQYITPIQMPGQRPEPVVFYSLMIIPKEGRKIEIPWGGYQNRRDKESAAEFRKVLSRVPHVFMKKWTNIPILDQEEKEIMKILKKKGNKRFLLIQEKLSFYGLLGAMALFLACTILLVIFGSFSEMISILLAIGVFFPFILMVPLVVWGNRYTLKKDKVKGQMGILDSLERTDLKTDRTVETTTTWEGKDVMKVLSEKEIEETIQYLGKYEPVKQTVMTLVGTFSLILGVITIIMGPVFFLFYFLGSMLLVLGIGSIVYIIVKSVKDFTKHYANLEYTIADEVRLRRNLLPRGYQTPKWFKLRRGKEPLSPQEIDRSRKWIRLGRKKALTISLFSMVGGMGALFLALPLMVVFDIGPILMFFLIPLPIIGFPLGMVIMTKFNGVMLTLDRVANWEKRSGVSFLPDEFRESVKEWNEWRKR